MKLVMNGYLAVAVPLGARKIRLRFANGHHLDATVKKLEPLSVELDIDADEGVDWRRLLLWPSPGEKFEEIPCTR